MRDMKRKQIKNKAIDQSVRNENLADKISEFIASTKMD